MEPGKREVNSPGPFRNNSINSNLNPTGPVSKSMTRVSSVSGPDLSRTITYRVDTSQPFGAPGSSKPPSGSPDFNQAFRSARQGGKSTFNFKGKSYTTELFKPSKPKNVVKSSSETFSIKTAGIQKPKIDIKAPVLLKKNITTTGTIPPKPPKKPPTPFLTGKYKRRTGRTRVGDFLRDIGDIRIQAPRIRLPRIRLPRLGGCGGGKCNPMAKNIFGKRKKRR
jgi:hypothetical protein